MLHISVTIAGKWAVKNASWYPQAKKPKKIIEKLGSLKASPKTFFKLISISFFEDRGGDFKRNISLSLGINNQEGVIVNSNNKTINFNMNAKRKAFNDKIDIYSKTYFTHKKGNAASVGNGEIFQQRVIHRAQTQQRFVGE